MRDLINIIQILSEDRALSASTILKRPGRFEKFISMIANKQPFYTVDQEPVVADPSEAKRFQQLYNTGKFSGTLKIKLEDDREIPLSQLLKTAELGGQAKKGEEGEETGKESALLKPSQIKITDKDIPASQLGQEIINNSVLQSTDYGRLVIEMAETIMKGGNPVIPKDVPAKIKDSIVDYAGEYLGVLALVSGTSRFPRKKGFTEWLGADVTSLVINFPSKANTNIADSYASISNDKTNHKINISSKGQGGGAPPSVSGLKVPDEIRNNPDYLGAVGFIDLCDNGTKQVPAKIALPAPRTISSVFAAMNLLNEVAPESIPQKFKSVLPWDVNKITNEVKQSIEDFKKNVKSSRPNSYPGKMPGYDIFFNDIKFQKPSSDGGKLTHAVKLAVMNAVNEGQAIPEFQDVVLSILDMNFIQQYADFDPKSRIMSFATQWPAKLEGQITLESKSGGTDPTKGGFSFKLSNTTPKTNLEEPNELGVGVEPDDGAIGTVSDLATSSVDIINPKRKEPEEKPRQVGDVGRQKRRS
jgi:hypothetical protein